MFTHTRGKHRRPSRRGRNLVALLSIAAFGLSTFVASQPATAANPSDPTFSTGIAFDGTGQGTASACPIIGAGGDNTANDAVVCTTAAYAVTQADLDAGSVTDTATAVGTPTVGDPVTHQSSATVPVTPAPGLKITKAGSLHTDVNGKQYIAYTFTVTNTGNQTLHAVEVHDSQAAPAGQLTTGPTCPKTVLAPGAVMTCHATYYFTQADVDHGSVSDTAVATGRTPKPTQVTSPPVTLKVTFVLKTPTTTPGLAHTGVPVLEIVGGGLLLLLGGLFLVVIGTRRRKA